MASKVSDLINKLKREMPELENNPLLDEIEIAAHETGDEPDEGSPDEEDQDKKELGGPDDSGEMNYDDMLPPEEDTGSEPAPPASAPKKKFPPYKK